ncbi:hypothetical protein HWV62_36384 [Athelia sp. TMB]|nr:hypothetical protein HWV62_36384 [Athelia sp. TMB]
MNILMDRVEDKTRQKLADHRLQLMPPDTVHRELLQELDRYPIVERALKESGILSDNALHEGLRDSLQNIIRESKGKGATKADTPAQIASADSASMTPIHTGTAQSSIPAGPSAIRKALNNSNSHQEEDSKSFPNSRSQSPDSMKMSSPEPPDSPVPPAVNGTTSDAKSPSAS